MRIELTLTDTGFKMTQAHVLHADSGDLDEMQETITKIVSDFGNQAFTLIGHKITAHTIAKALADATTKAEADGVSIIDFIRWQEFKSVKDSGRYYLHSIRETGQTFLMCVGVGHSIARINDVRAFLAKKFSKKP